MLILVCFFLCLFVVYISTSIFFILSEVQFHPFLFYTTANFTNKIWPMINKAECNWNVLKMLTEIFIVWSPSRQPFGNSRVPFKVCSKWILMSLSSTLILYSYRIGRAVKTKYTGPSTTACSNPFCKKGGLRSHKNNNHVICTHDINYDCWFSCPFNRVSVWGYYWF